MEPLISVIVPVYKAEKYLDRCVGSIVNQTYKNLEIILVDDGSPDSCPQICDRWAEKDNRIKVIHKENGGAADAKNTGLKIFKGDYVAFVDSDDFIETNMYERLYSIMLQYDCDIVDSLIKKIHSYDEVNSKSPNGDNLTFYDAENALRELIREKAICQTPVNKLYSRAAVEGIYFVKGKYIDDEYWTYRVIGKCRKYAFTTSQYYYYYQNSESAMGREYSLKRLDCIDALYERYKYVCDKFPNLEASALSTYLSALRYHHQCLSRKTEIDSDGAIRKELAAKHKGYNYGKIKKQMKLKYKIWFDLFLISPDLYSTIRNALKIGL